VLGLILLTAAELGVGAHASLSVAVEINLA
jgi:hypothetical protein